MKQSSDDAVPTAVGLAMIGMEALVTPVYSCCFILYIFPFMYDDVGYSIHLGVAVSETGGCYLQQVRNSKGKNGPVCS
ncbi:hypothetical protein PVK06_024257 [Gossypium arboreum]|uniref:Uncharacterized protein n=1 Tax=Gossypium arboreum TaxID=29729 RepID=A0ABR0PDQ1_GOSAR|nr:hypothetical protein PVK06_024257 [Gossypium arboreum]